LEQLSGDHSPSEARTLALNRDSAVSQVINRLVTSELLIVTTVALSPRERGTLASAWKMMTIPNKRVNL